MSIINKLKDFKNIAILVIIVVAVILLVSLFRDIYIGRVTRDTNTKTDTIFVDRYLPFKPVYRNITLPERVTFYLERETVKWDTLTVKGDTITLYDNDTVLVEVRSNFLTLYPNNPKLIGFDLTSNNISLDLLNKQGIEYTESYGINTTRNNYRYVNNQMTLKPKLFTGINISGEYYWRPLVNYHDLNINLNLKTGRFTYVGGINSYYYPTVENQIKFTPVVGIRYTP